MSEKTIENKPASLLDELTGYAGPNGEKLDSTGSPVKVVKSDDDEKDDDE